MSDDEPHKHVPVVSSSQLAQGAMPSLSEFEFGLIMASHAFHRWMVRCMAAAGYPGMSALDVLVLFSIHHRSRAKRLADICLVLNVEDTHLVTYAIRKLEAAGLVTSGKSGKEKTVTLTEKGEQACVKYREIREDLLVGTIRSLGLKPEAASELARELRALSGHYDQAARAAASI
ncbi:MAG: winged helix DNA-binding protein [Anderseniella sp.]|jgi:predicted MarR family transcription regulator|nr:winged helix DNA-binding protein [Anderseniella sp.]